MLVTRKLTQAISNMSISVFGKILIHQCFVLKSFKADCNIFV